MLPTLLKLGPLAIHSYGVMFAIAFLVAMHRMHKAAIRWDLDPDAISDASFGTLIVGLLGTRILYIAMFRSEFSLSDPIGLIAIWRGGLVFQGAIIPGLLFLVWFLRRKKQPFWRTLDVVCPAMAICHAIGRMGCFLNGCCYGRTSDLPWAIPFRRIPWSLDEPATGSQAFLDHCHRYGVSTTDAHWSLPVHPTQLYSTLALTLIFVLLLVLVRRFYLFDGFVFTTYLIVYSVFRFFNEYLRGDHNPKHLADMSDQQVISIFTMVALIGMMIFLWRRSKRVPRAPMPETS
ncbi:MAG: prolipoprotein diacylglyceryl transferase [bacterium]|nr:prolipoprotein diacylglyceryl transferase [bacterium]